MPLARWKAKDIIELSMRSMLDIWRFLMMRRSLM